ncbi:MAG TPA: hypothetical protein VHN14_14300 [Kofleriaceae bacterium]|jgi:hypothetical protein|nr:hypothetical protein [Kofleriaceae bacterium]
MMKIALAVIAVTGCEPGRSTFARHPTAATAFDRAGADPKALAIADRVVAAAGGAERWNQIKQLRWSESISSDGKVVLSFDGAWDRWNGRHHERLHSAANKTYSVDTSHNPTQSTRTGEGDVVIMRKLYEAGGSAFVDTGHGLASLPAPETQRAIAVASKQWPLDTALLCMPFLLEAPGTELAYAGEVATEEGKPPLDDLKVTLDPKDPSRNSTYHVMVERDTNLIERLDMIPAGQPDTKRVAYHPGQRVQVGGLSFATVYENIGVKGEVITFKDLAAGDPDDALYVPSIQ